MTTRAALHQLETLTYNVTEKEKDILTEVNGSSEKSTRVLQEDAQQGRQYCDDGINDRLSTCDGEFGRQKLFLGVHHCHLGDTRSGLHVHTETVLVSKLTIYVKLIRR